MRYILPVFFGLMLLGCTSYRQQAFTSYADSTPVAYSGGANGTKTVDAVDTGYFLKDEEGGSLWVPGKPRTGPSNGTIEANELRLQVRELATQLLETRNNDSLMGLVALPTSFVELNNFTETSPLGRYFAEAMYYEFNQRGFPIKEYRMNGRIKIQEANGEFALTRNLPALSTKQSWAAVLVGTYLVEPNGVFINARLVRPTDGMVLRTAQMILPSNPLLMRMTAKPPFTTKSIKIVSQGTPTARRAVAQQPTAKPKPVAQAPVIPPNSPYTGSAPDQGILPVPAAPESNNPSLMDPNAPMPAPMPGIPKNG